MASDLEIALVAVLKEFEKLQIRYVIGGSLASSLHGIPRATQDADVLAELHEAHAGPLVRQLERDFYISATAVMDAIRQRTSFNTIHLTNIHKIDVFVAQASGWHQEEMARSSLHPLRPEAPSSVFPFSSPEDNILHKLEWFRIGGETSEIQWKDVLGVLKVQKDHLDENYLVRWARDLNLEALLLRAFSETQMR